MSNAVSNTTTGHSMNARSWAQEATSWYLSHVDASASHQSNVKTYLRGPVVAITLSLLQQEPLPPAPVVAAAAASTSHLNGNDSKKESSSSSPASTSSPPDWRDFLAQETDAGTFEFNQMNEEAYSKLTRRTKARLEAFMAGMAYAAPPPSSSTSNSKVPAASPESAGSLGLVDGLAGFRKLTVSPTNGSSSNSSTTSTVTPVIKPNYLENGNHQRTTLHSTTGSKSNNCPQMGAEEITTRLELYIRTLTRVHAQQQECVLQAEPIRALKARARSIVLALVETVGTIRQQAPVLTRLLSTLLQELLAVDILGDQCVKLIRQVVSRYEHQTSFASLAFLSSPDDSAGKLAPMVLDFLKYSQQHYQDLVRDCELERMLSISIPSTLRGTFRTMEFHSIGHLLDVCREYQHVLARLELAPPSSMELPTGSGTGNTNAPSTTTDKKTDAAAIRQALRDLQREVLTVNGNVLPPVSSRSELLNMLQQTLNNSSFRVTRRHRRRRQRRKPSIGSVPALQEDYSEAAMTSEGNGTTTATSGSEASDTESDAVGKSSESSSPMLPARPPRPSFHLSTVDFLTRRLLLAASRTGTGGDAYFIVRDLFGGDDVAVVPRDNNHHHGKHLATTMEITSSTTQSITIAVHGTFDVYPSNMVGDCEPLIQLHTTTTEVIYLQSITKKQKEEATMNGGVKSDTGGDAKKTNGSSSTFNKKKKQQLPKQEMVERQTERSGWRLLSIRPALYERVDEWNTPS